ncbi:autotransporter outer membrane beta-barrel domain-containing protein [Succinispira mobilis]|uniref:autotransporter outer membrane beta-barrel domain-containing protein n=1 Tax=Succinispira mobilis TaxID=78120 RepID=UPI00036EFC24|nr:autotransporter outer membrane beta-barrel domain-containing protein [Succinispira mobilis]
MRTNLLKIFAKYKKSLVQTLTLSLILGSPCIVNATLPAQSFSGGQVLTITEDIYNISPGYALYVTDLGTKITVNNASITSTSPVHTIMADKFGQIILNNVNVLTTSSHSVVANRNGSITINGGSIVNKETRSFSPGLPFYIAAGSESNGTLTLNNVSIQAAGTALFANTTSILNANVNGQNISGKILMNLAEGGEINLNASNGSQLYGYNYIYVIGTVGKANLTLNSGATWTLPANSPVTNLTLNNGNVVFTAPTASYKTLTLNNNLAGVGGTFRLHSNLANNQSDKLVITGNSSGNHKLYLNNAGDLPNNTTQAIKVVDLNTASTNTATFSGGADVGIYRYGIAQGTTLSNYSGLSGAEDYYAYNTFSASTPVQVGMNSNLGAQVLGYAEQNEIKKRLGEVRFGQQSSDDIWLRTYAERFSVKPANSSSLKQNVRGIEVGKDNPVSYQGGKRFLGFVVGAGKASNSFETTESSSGSSNSFYLGAYSSWVQDDGAYLDLISKYNWFRHSFDAQLVGGGTDHAAFKNRGLSLSAEVGKRFKQQDGVFIEPQAELAAFWATEADYQTSNGLNIKNPEAQSLMLRLGCAVGKSWQTTDGKTQQIYAKASWLHEFKGESQTIANNVVFDSNLKGSQAVTGIGFIEDSAHKQVYLDLEKSWGSKVSKDWGLNVGVRWKF